MKSATSPTMSVTVLLLVFPPPSAVTVNWYAPDSVELFVCICRAVCELPEARFETGLWLKSALEPSGSPEIVNVTVEENPPVGTNVTVNVAVPPAVIDLDSGVIETAKSGAAAGCTDWTVIRALAECVFPPPEPIMVTV